MNPLLAGAGGACAALAAAEVVALLARPATVAVLSAMLGPVAVIAQRGRAATHQARLLLGALVASTGFLLLALVGHPWLGLAVAASAPAGATFVIRFRLARWRSQMRSGAAGAALAIGEASASGLDGVAGIERAAFDGAVSATVATELQDLATRCRLGLSLEDGLQELRRRAGAGPWDAIVAALLVQRSVGGDLSKILGGIASGLEASVRARAEARSLSAQARLTARIVIAMPLVGVALGEIASPGTLGRIVASPVPRALAASAVVLQLLAVVAVRRAARVGGPRR